MTSRAGERADKRGSAFEVEITSNGQRIGSMSGEAFRASVGEHRRQFLVESVANFNRAKERAGEPERAEIVLARRG